MRACLGSWCCHLAAARTALGVKDSNGCKPFVPEAVEYNKESHRTMKLFHGELIMASITHGRSISAGGEEVMKYKGYHGL